MTYAYVYKYSAFAFNLFSQNPTQPAASVDDQYCNRLSHTLNLSLILGLVLFSRLFFFLHGYNDNFIIAMVEFVHTQILGTTFEITSR